MKKISFPRKYEMSWWISTEYVNVDFVIGEHLCDAPHFSALTLGTTVLLSECYMKVHDHILTMADMDIKI